jgi:hypothetical protein
MSHPDALDLYNECLSIAEQTTDDATAERVLLIAFRLLQLADDEIASQRASRYRAADPQTASPGTMASLS